MILIILVPDISLHPAEPDAKSMRYKAVGRTIKQIEADIAAVKANPNWITDPNHAMRFAALMEEKDILTKGKD